MDRPFISPEIKLDDPPLQAYVIVKVRTGDRYLIGGQMAGIGPVGKTFFIPAGTPHTRYYTFDSTRERTETAAVVRRLPDMPATRANHNCVPYPDGRNPVRIYVFGGHSTSPGPVNLCYLDLEREMWVELPIEDPLVGNHYWKTLPVLLENTIYLIEGGFRSSPMTNLGVDGKTIVPHCPKYTFDVWKFDPSGGDSAMTRMFSWYDPNTSPRQPFLYIRSCVWCSHTPTRIYLTHVNSNQCTEIDLENLVSNVLPIPRNPLLFWIEEEYGSETTSLQAEFLNRRRVDGKQFFRDLELLGP